MFQHAVIEMLLGNDFLELAVLIFEFFETLGLLRLHAAVLVLPAMKSRFAHTKGLQNSS